LIMNGIEAMSESMQGQRQLHIRSANDESGRVRVAVEDSGPGLDPARADQLFEAFFTTKPEGMGMGLSICRSIIDAHGGRLWASPSSSSRCQRRSATQARRDGSAYDLAAGSAGSRHVRGG
jgi:signal transduction histidine kinase